MPSLSRIYSMHCEPKLAKLSAHAAAKPIYNMLYILVYRTTRYNSVFCHAIVVASRLIELQHLHCMQCTETNSLDFAVAEKRSSDDRDVAYLSVSPSLIAAILSSLQTNLFGF